jgi:hypothetical protein
MKLAGRFSDLDRGLPTPARVPGLVLVTARSRAQEALR